VGRQIALLVNPGAGRGRGARTAAIALPRLREAGFAVRHLVGRDAGEALDLARAAVEDEVEALVVVGGDGMVHLAAQVLAGTGVPLGVLPAGTGNDVARYVGIPRSDPQRAADVVVASHTRTIDLARAGATYFVTVLAAGFDALVNERANAMTWPRGQMRYNLATLAELRVFEPRPYTLELDGRVLRLEAMLVAVGNGPSFGGGLRITHGAEIDDGLLDVVVIGPMSRAGLVRTYPRLYSGSHTRHPAYQHHRVREVTVAAPGIVAYADGERVGALPLTVEAVPGGLTVLVPPGPVAEEQRRRPRRRQAGRA
jgi:diacylglycerol kinase (ATP)